MKTRQIITVVIVLAIIGGAILGMNFLFTLKEEPKKRAVAQAVKLIKTEKVMYGDVGTKVVAFGRTASSLPLDVIAEVKGKLISGNIPLKEGQRFAQGALLFRIDDTEAKLTLQSQKSEFLKDLASVLPDFKVDFPKNYDKWLKYFESVNLDESLPELPTFETNKEKTYLATKNIFTKYYAIKSAEFNLSKYNVHAPFSGTISEVSLYVGAFANSGAKVCKILKTSNLELKVPVETGDINWLTIGNEVDIKTEDNAQHWKGQIARIGDFVNPTTQSIDVFIHVLSSEHKIYEGMYLEATMPGAIIKDAMEIPRNAVFAGSKVYTMKDSLLESKNIKILKINSESVVFQGLNEGEELVIEPLVGASENLKVAKLRENIDVEVTKKNEGFEVKKTKFEPEENKEKPKEKN